MEIETTLNLGFALGLFGIGIAYWRSHQIARATQDSLQQELDTLKQVSQQTQAELEQRLHTKLEALQATQREKAELEDQVEALKQQCLRLRSQVEIQSSQTQEDSQTVAFEKIQMLLTQYPSVRRMAESKPDLPARNLVAMFTPLDNLLSFWGIQKIGNPWELVDYDPQIHQSDLPDFEVGEAVYVRFVGYRQSDRILIPAKVSRTLPAGASS